MNPPANGLKYAWALRRMRPDRHRKFGRGSSFYAKKVTRFIVVETRQMIIVVHGGGGDD